jgi:hypothetical protein
MLMRLWKSATGGLASFLGGSRGSNAVEDSIEEIRELMLEGLGTSGAATHASLGRRIRHAQDSRALWDLRGDLMAALSSSLGEVSAREKMFELSKEFQGLLPASLATRPSPLA